MLTYEELNRKRLYTQYEVDHHLFLKADVNEIAVIFPDKEALYDFVAAREKEGMINFNGQRDVMRCQSSTRPMLEGSSFNVTFEFLKKPEDTWRIEAMCITQGYAPIHEERLHQVGNGASIMHASWKHASFQEYERIKKMMRGDDQLGLISPLTMAAEYVNTYGVFSYWKWGDIYLKPRVNLRDN